VFGFYITNITWAILGFLFMEQWIKFASQTNSKHRFKEQEEQADMAKNRIDEAF
jgi:hypothetical protein